MNDSFTLREYVTLVENSWNTGADKNKEFWEKNKELNNIFVFHHTNFKPVERLDFYRFARSLLKVLPKEEDIAGWFLGIDFKPLPDLDVTLFGDKCFVDIELKDKINSQNLDKIAKQFNNQSHLFKKIDENKPVLYLVYIAQKDRLYHYNIETNKYDESYNFSELFKDLKDVVPSEENPLNKLSRGDFIISPLNNLNEFIKGQYFLDTAQEQIKNELLKNGIEKHKGVFGVEGAPGSGKSLIAYDLVKSLPNEKILFIYPGNLKEKHSAFGKQFSNIKFCAGKDLTTNILFNYNIVLIDEAQRLYYKSADTWEILKKWIKNNNDKSVFIFFFDKKQSLSSKECGQLLNSLCNTYEKDGKGKLLKLKTRIRSNSYISYFVKNLFSLNKRAPKWVTTLNYSDNIEVKYFQNSNESFNWIKLKIKEGYKFLLPTKDNYSVSTVDNFDSLAPLSKNTHEIIGEEEEKIVTIIDDSMSYTSQGELKTNSLKTKDYFYYMENELYVNLTRAKEKLAIAVINNFDVYKGIINEIFNKNKEKENFKKIRKEFRELLEENKISKTNKHVKEIESILKN